MVCYVEGEMVFTTDELFIWISYRKLAWVGLEPTSYQAMKSIHTQGQLCTTTPKTTK